MDLEIAYLERRLQKLERQEKAFRKAVVATPALRNAQAEAREVFLRLLVFQLRRPTRELVTYWADSYVNGRSSFGAGSAWCCAKPLPGLYAARLALEELRADRRPFRRHLRGGPRCSVLNGGGAGTGRRLPVFARVVRRAKRLLQVKGLGHLVRGHVLVLDDAFGTMTGFMSRDAVYLVNRPEQTEDDFLWTFLHEIGHRVLRSALDSDRALARLTKQALASLYELVEAEERVVLKVLWKAPPKRGTVHRHWTRSRAAVRLKLVGYLREDRAWLRGPVHSLPGPDVVLYQRNKDGEAYHQSFASFCRSTGRIADLANATSPRTTAEDLTDYGVNGFVSAYARTNPQENFCDMFAGWVLGRLSERQTESFEPLVSSVKRLAK